MQKLLLISAILFLLGACSQNEKTAVVKEEALPTYLLSTGNTTAIADVSTHFKDLHIIPLNEEVSRTIGMIFHFVVIDSSMIVIADELSHRVCAIDFKGNLLWKVDGRKDDFRHFERIKEFAYNSFEKEIIVYGHGGIFRYSLAGEPLGKISSAGLYYHQLHFYSKDEIIFASQAHLNGHLMDESKQLNVVKNGDIVSTHLEMLYQAPDVFVGGYPRFTQMNGQLIYHPTFRDIFYSVDLPRIEPAFKFEFTGRTTTEEVMKMKNVKNKIGYCLENGIPTLYNLAADDQSLLLNYRHASGFYNAKINRATGEPFYNAKYLSYEGTTFLVPILYNNGFLLWSYPEYEVELAKEIPAGSTELPAGWAEKLQKAKEADLDLGKKYLYLLEV